jgi:DNA-binding XRE family transcriptional regulator
MPGAAKRSRGRPRKRETQLSKWIDSSGMTREEVAEKLGIARQHLDRLCRAENRPSLTLAADIEKMTRGAVPAVEWARMRIYRD